MSPAAQRASTIPPPPSDLAERIGLSLLDRSMREANAVGLLQYTLADLADARARIAELELELALLRGVR